MTLRLQELSLYLCSVKSDLSNVLKSLGHSTRFEILARAIEKEISFAELEEALNVGKTNLSNHLLLLISSNLIEKVDRGTYLATQDGIRIMEVLADYYRGQQKMKLMQLQGSYLNKFPKVEEMELTENIVKNKPKFVPSWFSYLGSIAGVLQSFGEKYDINDIAGYSGYAFFINVSTKSTYAAAPTFHNFWENFDNGVSSLGYPLSGFYDSGSVYGNQGLSATEISRLNKLQDYVKTQIDRNNPVILWGLDAPEFGIVIGYEKEEYVTSTFKSIMEESKKNSEHTIHYTNLESPGGLWAYHFLTKKSEPNEETDKIAIENAINILRGTQAKGRIGFNVNDQWQDKEVEFVSGLEAYSIWADNLENGDIDLFGNSYVAECYHEAKKCASIFLGRLAKKYKDREFGKNLSAASEKYSEVANLLRQVTEMFPFPNGEYKSNQNITAANFLRKAKEIELEAFEQLKIIEKQW